MNRPISIFSNSAVNKIPQYEVAGNKNTVFEKFFPRSLELRSIVFIHLNF